MIDPKLLQHCRTVTPFPWLAERLPVTLEEMNRFGTEIDGLAERLAALSKVHLWVAATAVQVFYREIGLPDLAMMVGGMLTGAIHKALNSDEPFPVVTPIGHVTNELLKQVNAHRHN